MENKFYRANLEEILRFSSGRHLLNMQEVGQFTGIRDRRTLRKMFPFQGKHISAANLAHSLSEVSA